MKFDQLEKRMRAFETAQDQAALPDVYMVARLDGRGFTRLTKEVHRFEAPFDESFLEMMVATTEHLMACGFQVDYGHTQSDEISLLFALREAAFGRRLRKFNSVLAGEASARFSLLLGDLAVFDCRVLQLPTPSHVVDYFQWRAEDAHRNALNAHCYWALRKEGRSAGDATKSLLRLPVKDKNELLFQRGINFNDLPAWQKRGVGLDWETYEKEATNPRTGEATTALRRRIRRNPELPLRDAYEAYLLALLQRSAES